MGCGSSKPEDGGDSAAGDRGICRRFGEIRRLRLSGGRSRKDSTVRLLNPEEGEDAVTAAMEEASTGGTLHSSSGFCSACGACCVPPMENNLGTQPPSTATVMTPPPVVDVVRPRVEKAAAVAADSPPEKNEAESGREGEKKQMKVNPRITEEAEKMDAEEGKREKNRLEEAEDITEDDKEAAALVCSAGALLTYDEGELPGSPSFRVYFVGSARQAVDDEPLDPNTASLGKLHHNVPPCRRPTYDLLYH